MAAILRSAMRLNRSRSLRVARHQVVEVAVEEAVFPDALEHQVQVEPQVLDRLLGARRAATRRHVDALLEAGEELLDDLLLVAEVVVEVAGAHVERLGDHPGGHVGLAALVEELQASARTRERVRWVRTVLPSTFATMLARKPITRLARRALQRRPAAQVVERVGRGPPRRRRGAPPCGCAGEVHVEPAMRVGEDVGAQRDAVARQDGAELAARFARSRRVRA
jgi:hypothetical protein